MAVLERYSSQDISQPLQDIIIHIGDSLLEHARFSGADLFLPTSDSTHLVSVLGPIDIQKDDWLFSDFCLLQKVLGGAAKSEHWLTGVDLHSSITTLGQPIRHGPPGNVKTIFDDRSDRFYTTVAPSVLAETFLSHIQQAASSASEGDQILIVVVARGSPKGEVAIGVDDLGHLACVTHEDIEARLACAHHNIRTTIISTACHSGIWLLPLPPTKFSDALAAVPAEEASHSLPISPPLHHDEGEFTNMFANLVIPSDNRKTVMEASTFVETTNGQQVIKQAISIADIMTTSTMDRPPTIGLWTHFLQGAVHSLTTNPQSLPICHSDNSNLPASMILGCNEELSTIIHAEALLSLSSVAEDTNHPNNLLSNNLTTIALGIEEIFVVKSEGTHRPLSSLVLHLSEKYMVRGKIYAAPNLHFTRIRHKIQHQNPTSNDELQEAYNLLRTRLKADQRATFVTSHYNPEFVEHQSVEHWDGPRHMTRFIRNGDWDAFTTVLNRFLHDCQDRHPDFSYQYTLPRDYAVEAAINCGLSPSELEERLESLPKDPWNASLYPSSSSALGSSGSWRSLDEVKALVEKSGRQ